MAKRQHKRRRRGTGDIVMGVAWYRPEQWARLRQVSSDVDELEETHEEWLRTAERTLGELTRHEMKIRKVDVDVEELVLWCEGEGRAVDASARADFVTGKLQSEP